MIQTKAVLLVLMLLSASCQAVPAGGYVALGDGYSSGDGTGSYDLDSGSCHRSSLAFPALWAHANNPTYFRFAACNGASIEDVTTRQLESVSADTAIISLTVGVGNAKLTGLFGLGYYCAANPGSSCNKRAKGIMSTFRAELPVKLDALYKAIRAKAPKASVVVLGYPRLYSGSGVCENFPRTTQSIFNNLLDTLNNVIQVQAAQNGFLFGNVSGIFTGHDICSAKSWLDGAFAISSFSVTTSGHRDGYLSVFNDNLSS